jgi:hypothetical protein
MLAILGVALAGMFELAIVLQGTAAFVVGGCLR